MSASEKAKTTDRFADINDPCPVLVCTFRSTAFGVNLQRGCAKLVMMGMPENINTLLQTIGRIHRLGQPKIQECLGSRDRPHLRSDFTGKRSVFDPPLGTPWWQVHAGSVIDGILSFWGALIAALPVIILGVEQWRIVETRVPT